MEQEQSICSRPLPGQPPIPCQPCRSEAALPFIRVTAQMLSVRVFSQRMKSLLSAPHKGLLMLLYGLCLNPPMSFHFACRQPPVKRSNIELCLRFRATGAGPTCFPIHERYRFPAPPSCTKATCNVIGVLIHHVNPLKPSPSDGPKYHVSLMARNSLLPI